MNIKSEVKKMDEEILEVLKDLSFINAVIATELLRITENTALIAKKPEEKVRKCVVEHNRLGEKIIELVEKYRPADTELLKSHVLKH
jgi:hypothetical protein